MPVHKRSSCWHRRECHPHMKHRRRDLQPNFEELLFRGRQPRVSGPGVGRYAAMPVSAKFSFNPGPVLRRTHSALESARFPGRPRFDRPIGTLHDDRISGDEFPRPIVTTLMDGAASDHENNDPTGRATQ
jgi:hypothetical protein